MMPVGIVVLCGQAVGVVYFSGERNCEVVVVVVVVVPPSDGQLTLGDDVECDLFEFGLAIVLSGRHAHFG